MQRILIVRRLILALALMATPAVAEEPATLILPTAVVTAMMQRLAQDPAVQILQALQNCIAAQVPNASGAAPRGECPAVTAAMTAKPSTP